MPDNDPKWAAQKRCDNNRKDVKAERRKITNWVKDAEKELKTGLPISGRRKGRELKLQRRIAEQARQHPVDCLAAAREFLRQFKAEYDAPTPQPSDPISSGEGTPRERDEISDDEDNAPTQRSHPVPAAAGQAPVSPHAPHTPPTTYFARH